MNIHDECTRCGSCWGCRQDSFDTFTQLLDAKQSEVDHLRAALDGVKTMARAMAADLEELRTPLIASLLVWQVYDNE